MLAELLQRADLWRGRQTAPAGRHPTLATGYTALDRCLPNGGWPAGAVTEILHLRMGVGELQPTLPVLRQLGRGERWIAWIDPPHIPYAPALAYHGLNMEQLFWIRTRSGKESLWALEQTLRSGSCGAVLGWVDRCSDRTLRRLQLAAEYGEALTFLFRPLAVARTPSPAALRLSVRRRNGALTVKVLKSRGRWAGDTIRLSHDTPPYPVPSHSATGEETADETATP